MGVAVALWAVAICLTGFWAASLYINYRQATIPAPLPRAAFDGSPPFSKDQIRNLLRRVPQTPAALREFMRHIGKVRVLDPACGSGNFLYVALKELLDLSKEVAVLAHELRLPSIPLEAGPHQLFGLEVNEYAHELAQIVVWIGYIQWLHENGYSNDRSPILGPQRTIEQRDAILGSNDSGEPSESAWPDADIIIGNPPFLGGKRLRAELGDEYVNRLFDRYGG
ncbi:MAG TPA: DNA methyltransferase, partial [Chloroflexota bacterium]